MKQQWYIDSAKKLFVTSEKNPAPVTVNKIPFGSVIDLELFFVSASSPVYDFLEWSANLGYDVIISAGIINGRATGGTVTLSGSAAIAYNATAGEVQTALNAILSPRVVTVRQADGGYYVKDNATGTRTRIVGVGTNLTPASDVVVREVTTGDTGVYEEVFITYERKPLVVANTFTSIDNGRRGTLAFDNTALYAYLGTNSSVTLALTVTVKTPDGYVDVPINQNITITAGISTEPGTAGPSYPSALTLETANKNFIQNRSDITGFSGTGDEYLDGIATVALQLNTKLSFAAVDGTEYLATLKFGTNTESLVAPIIVLPDDYDASTNAKYWKVNTTKGDQGEQGEPGEDGVDGDDGANGTNGLNGEDGKTLTASAIDPDDGDGVDGDTHINTDTKDVFKKTAGTWVLLDNIAGGPAGAAALFTSGSTVPADIDGEDGYAYLRTTNNDFYIKVSGAWGSPIGNLTGGTGLTGTRGSKWFSGSGAPGTVSGSADGDLYLRTSNNALYEKVAGSWGSPIANISGASGNQIRVGTGVPSDAVGSDGDIYINDANGAMYKKASSTWGSAFYTPTAGGGTWGSILGVLADQGDLQEALDLKADATHTHVMADVTDAGNAATKDVGTAGGDVAAGDDARFPTSDEKAALAGTDGTPGAANKFVTDSDPRLAPDAGDVGAIPTTEKGAANGVAELDSSGKLPLSQTPDAVVGALNFQTTWNATTNTPTLPTAAAGNKGHYYLVTTGGTYSGTTYDVGDWVISDGATWGKCDNTDSVVSVAGRIGAIVLEVADITDAGDSATKDVGTTAGTVAAGDDSRFTDARAPLTNIVNAYTKQQYFTQYTLTDGATISWDADLAQSATVTLAGNRTLANPTNLHAGATYLLLVKQDATGSRTLAYGSNYKWPGGVAPVLTSGVANAIDMLSFYSDGTYLYGAIGLKYS